MKLSPWILSLALPLALSLVAALPAHAIGTLEVVESVPQDTTLAVPGVRHPQEVWVEMFHAARTTIDLEQFYVTNQPGEALDPVLAALRDAASRGVKIRLLVDSKFFQQYPDDVVALGQVPGITARAIDFSSYGGIQHSKYFVVDGAQSFVGSQNFDWRALDQIHEIGLRATDPAIATDLETIFEKDWAAGVPAQRPAPGAGAAHPATRLAAPAAGKCLRAAAPRNVSPQDGAQARVVASPAAANPPGIPFTGDAISALLSGAQHSARIQVMEYAIVNAFSPSHEHWTMLDDAIRQAAARGVHVELAVDVSDLRSARNDLRALAQVPNVEVRVATIPQLASGPIPYARLIHSKYLVVDGARGWVGSENWSESYFLSTRDVGIRFEDAAVAGTLTQVFDQLWQSGYVAAP